MLKHYYLSVLCALMLPAVVLSCKDDDEPASPVNDILMEFSVPENYFLPTTDAWIFASDESGKQIDVVQLKNGETAVLKRKNGFTGDVFSLTELRYYGSRAIINTYTEFKSGKHGYSPRVSTAQVGNASVSMSDTPEQASRMSFNLISPGVQLTSTNYEPGIMTFNFLLYNSPTSYILTYNDIYNKDVRFLSNEVSANDNQSLSSHDMKPMQLQELTVTKGDYVRISLTGRNEKGKYPDYLTYDLFVDEASKVPLYYPPGLFDSFSTSLSVLAEHITHEYRTYQTSLPTEMKYLNAAITGTEFRENKCMVNIKGKYDFIEIDKILETDDFFQYWLVVTKGNIERNIPQLPIEITEKYPRLSNYNGLHPDVVYVYDYEGIASYEEHISDPILSNPNPKQQSNCVYSIVFLDENGGMGKKGRTTRGRRSADLFDEDVNIIALD